MSKRAIAIAAWLAGGHAVLGGLYWLLLQIPESNVLMLSASLLVVVLMVAAAAVVQAVGLAGWPAASAREALNTGLRHAVWFMPAMAVFGVLWLATGFAANWLGALRGEIDAWFIARLGWADVSWLHTTLAWILWFVRYVWGTALAVAIMAAGPASVTSARWLARACHWRTLALVTAVLLLGFFLPWHYFVFWRPASLPPTWVQPVFASVKLGMVYLVMNVAWAAVLWWGARQAGTEARAASQTQPVAGYQ